MTRRVLYVAHPVRPTDEEIEAASQIPAEWARTWAKRTTDGNLHRAMAWLRWLRASFPEATFIAPWIASILSGEDDSNPAQREAGLVDDCAVVERCDGIVLCGPRISDGMRREMEHGAMRRGDYLLRFSARRAGAGGGGSRPILPDDGFEVYDLTGYGNRPPGVFERGDGAYQEFEANATRRTYEDAERLWRLGNGR